MSESRFGQKLPVNWQLLKYRIWVCL